MPRIVVTMTDGAHNCNRLFCSENPRKVAKQMRSGGVIMFAIGVNKYVKDQLEDLASDPPSTFVKTVNQFADLTSAVKDIAAAVCTAGLSSSASS